MKWVVRYSAYCAFAAITPFFWMIVFSLLFGYMPLPGDPACHFEPQGCPEPGMFTQAMGVDIGLSAFPLTVLAFIFFRKSARRALGLPELRAPNDR